MIQNRMHARLDRKIKEFESLKDETLAYLSEHRVDIECFIESIRDHKNIWEINKESKDQVVQAIVGMNYSMFVDEHIFRSFGFWANGDHGWNLIALMKIQTEFQFTNRKGYYRTSHTPWGFTLEGSNAAEMYKIAWNTVDKCFVDYEKYMNRRTKAYHSFFDTVSPWVYNDGNYTRDYDFYVEHGRDMVKDYISELVLGSVRPLTY